MVSTRGAARKPAGAQNPPEANNAQINNENIDPLEAPLKKGRKGGRAKKGEEKRPEAPPAIEEEKEKNEEKEGEKENQQEIKIKEKEIEKQETIEKIEEPISSVVSSSSPPASSARSVLSPRNPSLDNIPRPNLSGSKRSLGAISSPLVAPESPSVKLRRLDVSLQKSLSVEFERLNAEFQSRVDSFKHACEGELTSLRFFFNRQLTRLPPRVRQMSVEQFCSQFGLDVQSVNMENAVARQKELETFVAQTPSLRTSRKHRELLSLQAPIGVLMSAQRMTRASARKAMMSEGFFSENQNTANAQPITAAPIQPLVAPPTVSRVTRGSRASVRPAFETPANGRRLRARGGKELPVDSNMLLTVDHSVNVDLSAPTPDLVRGLNTLGAEERGKIVGKLKNMAENVSRAVAEIAQ